MTAIGGGFDRFVQRAWARYGWRFIPRAVALGYLFAAALMAVGTLVVRRIEGLSDAEALAVMGIAVVFLLGAFLTVLAVLVRTLRPLIGWLSGPRGPEGAAEALDATLRAPEVVLRWTLGYGAVTNLIGTAVEASLIDVDLSGAAVISIVYLLFTFLLAVGTLGAGQIVVQPAAEEITRVLGARAEVPAGIGLRGKLLILIPLSLLGVTGLGVSLAVPPGAGLAEALPDLATALPLVVVFAFPMALLLAHASLDPLNDVLRATERMKEGDYTTRVPVTSADEAGLLARSFNEAMVGLAEREQLASEVRASRARIVAASDAERRRVERNIHDGAQQQLVGLALKLRALEEEAPESMRPRLAEASERLKSALAELRELARGLHPSVLTTDGLAPALEQLAARAAVPVDVDAPRERYEETVESTAYFVVSEALANVGKYAQATRAEVTIQQRDGRLLVAVSDDGIGGVDIDAGSGLSGLRDRVAALDGTLTVDSPAGRGTTVTAELALA